MSEITTRRAIEIVLSRVRLNRSATDDLCYALSLEIERTAPDQALGDIDEMRAAMRQIDILCSGVSDFPRKSLLARIELAREVARRIA